jgi:hypothetical protein
VNFVVGRPICAGIGARWVRKCRHPWAKCLSLGHDRPDNDGRRCEMTDMGEQSNVSNPEFFFRTADRLQMDSCILALSKEGKSVVIHSRSNELLDYYGASFLRRLKKRVKQQSN